MPPPIGPPFLSHVVVDGGAAPVPLKGVLRVGRNQRDIPIDDLTVSRFHCALDVGEQLEIIDLGSETGTFVNGKPINKAKLRVGDVVRLGPRLVYADRLLERGDPRGELIRYQCEGRHDLADALLARHELDWIRPFTYPLQRWAFHAGFVTGVCARDPRGAMVAVGEDHPVTSAMAPDEAPRDAQPDDAESIARLVNQAYLMEASFVAGDRTSEDEVRAMMAKGVFVIVGHGAPAACVYIELRGERAYFGMLAVDPMWQKAGLGGQMVATAEARARAAGCKRMDLLVINIRTELLAWYGKLGYRTGVRRLFTDKQRLKRPDIELIEMSKDL